MATKPVTFNIGWEIEATRSAFSYPQGVRRISDGSVSGDGTEYILDPGVVGDNVKAMRLLRDLVKDREMRVGPSCGFHVHISPNGLSKDKAKAWAGWMVTLARMIEDKVFESVPNSRRDNSYCRRLKSTKHSIHSRRYCRSKYSNDDRYFWINVVEMMRPGGLRTVEIRLLGSTRRFVWLQAWVAVCLYMARISSDLMSDPSSLQARVEDLNSKFERLKIFMTPNHPESPSLSRIMAKNMGLVDIDKTDNLLYELKKLQATARRVKNGNYSYYGSSNPRYTREQVEFYLNQEYDEATREYSKYLYDWDCAIEHNQYVDEQVKRKREREALHKCKETDTIIVDASGNISVNVVECPF